MRTPSAISGSRILILGAWPMGSAVSPGLLRGDLFGMRSQRLQDDFGSEIQGFAFTNDGFGGSLSVGDFNGDGFDDLAISDHESLTDQHEGAVHVLYSDRTGLTGNDQLFEGLRSGYRGG